jgi:hypothetical protein
VILQTPIPFENHLYLHVNRDAYPLPAADRTRKFTRERLAELPAATRRSRFSPCYSAMALFRQRRYGTDTAAEATTYVAINVTTRGPGKSDATSTASPT